ncbi:hypothetical protein [Calditerrivibrio nitroreducens]|uniref:Uncharacterized protein n=1 Tax=Calditerrivibrio nitroreducens (strain DSM 19672 / NBRC 101217 / Yu37-1) TaxID=768670 RepID=E4TIW9_CALNY|nr:hypothetical protein [Calditerrivibrio nitroreducens]ADR19101.1 hypothetical protein Calni_1193 [Calditerrivibrio nitroreducens DSM 19672]
MRKEAEILLNQISELAFKIRSTSEYEKVEELLTIYFNFLDQLISILKDEPYEDIATNLNIINNNLNIYLNEMKKRIRDDIESTNRKVVVSNRFNYTHKEIESLIDKKI